MLGHRGCRIAVSYPEIYQMQIEAIFEAAYSLQAKKIDVRPEIMIPLIMNEAELKMILYGKKIEGSQYLGLVDVEKTTREKMKAKEIKYKLGTMIELPASALSAGNIARYAQFFSFGTNDLTQTTLGLSRDDFTSFMPEYSLYDLMSNNPFRTLEKPVKELILKAVQRGTITRPDLLKGLCGEHGAEPENIAFCIENGLDYVSCSTFSVPIASLAVAQTLIKKKMNK
jgi:pyruvate,orthophosphate dikinase